MPFLLLFQAFYPKNRGKWKALSSWEPPAKDPHVHDDATVENRWPPDVRVKKGYTWTQELGIAIAALVDDGKMSLIDWTKKVRYNLYYGIDVTFNHTWDVLDRSFHMSPQNGSGQSKIQMALLLRFRKTKTRTKAMKLVHEICVLRQWTRSLSSQITVSSHVGIL